MKKQFTKEEILKKHQTNVKSAQGAFGLAGVLGIIYIVRYIIAGNFDFYFSLSVSEVSLRFASQGILSAAAAWCIIGIFLAAYLILTVLNMKNPRFLTASLALYATDCLCLGAYLIFAAPKPLSPDCFIDVIIHLFIIIFLVVGLKSTRAIKE